MGGRRKEARGGAATSCLSAETQSKIYPALHNIQSQKLPLLDEEAVFNFPQLWGHWLEGKRWEVRQEQRLSERALGPRCWERIGAHGRMNEQSLGCTTGGELEKAAREEKDQKLHFAGSPTGYGGWESGRVLLDNPFLLSFAEVQQAAIFLSSHPFLYFMVSISNQYLFNTKNGADIWRANWEEKIGSCPGKHLVSSWFF